MVEDPEVDGRRREQLRDQARSLAPYYADEWDPGGDDPGTVLLELFADLAEDVVERLDQVPEKHRVSFLDSMGFERDPPQPAELPLVVAVEDDAEGNVPIESGSRATATAGDDGEQVFRLREGFEATPANVEAVYSVDPGSDGIFDHADPLAAGESTRLFHAGESTDPADDVQRHALYVGHADYLDLGSGGTIEVVVETAAPASVVRDDLVWEYYGEKTVDGEDVTDWHEFPDGPDVSMLASGSFRSVEEAIEQVRALLGERGYRLDDAGLGTTLQFLLDVLTDPVTPMEDDRELWTSMGQLYVVHDDARVAFDPAHFESEPDLHRATEKLHDALSKSVAVLEAEVDGVAGNFDRAVRVLFDLVVDDLHKAFVDHESFEEPDVPRELRSLDEFETGPWPDALSATLVAVARHAVKAGLLGDAADGDRVEFTLVTDGTVEERAVNGVESRWIRCRTPRDDDGPDLFDFVVGPDEQSDGEYRPSIRIGSRAENLRPDRMLANDVPVAPGDGPVRPFGDWPRLQDAFYLACADAFTKTDAEVTITFGAPAADPSGADGPTLSWEYYDGDGWTGLDDLTDTTEDLQVDGTVSFTVPPDLEPTEVDGHEEHWIRVRMVGGDYGDHEFEKREVDVDGETVEKWTTERAFDEPSFESVTVSYDEQRSPTHLLAENNRSFGPDLVADEHGRFEPFEPVPESEQTLYLGFDAPLHDGPITLLFEMADVEYPADFHPGVRWEYFDGEEWTRPSVRDGTAGLTEPGVVSFVFEEATAATGRFDEQLHWLRARVARQQFGPGEEETGSPPERGTPECAPDPCARPLRTEPPGGLPRRHRPALDAVHPNAGSARNVRTVDEEVVGSSDGTRDQTFEAAERPVVDPTVWVDELGALGPDRRGELAAADPDGVDPVEGDDGDLTAFWVRWSRQSDLLDADPDDRHYTLDPVAGRITFGDGTRGRIPPAGSENVRASYETGGGAAGNVEPGAVEGLVRSLPFVDEVTNPLGADGGADAESTAAVAERAPRALRDRGRAVTATDYERIAMDAARRLARVRCLPGMDRYGRYRPGWVTLLVVPEGRDPKPTPSVSLKRQVEAAVADRAPTSLVDLDARDQFVVRGPSYVSVSADVELVSTGATTVSSLEESAREALVAFFDPLSGGSEGEGWDFGEVPCPSDCYALLEDLDGVDHVVELVLRFEGADDVRTVVEGEETPPVAADVLVHGGVHDVVAYRDRPAELEGA